MTKKHFIALADAIKQHNARTLELTGGVAGPLNDRATFNMAHLDTLANFCADQNPRFDRERWLGYIAETNGPSGGKRKAKRTATVSGVCKDCGNGTLNNTLNPAFELEDYPHCLACGSTHLDIL